jgi:hypothetical protein
MSGIESDPPPTAFLAGEPITHRQLPPVRVWALALTAGVIAGFASWLIGETFRGRFNPPVAAASGPRASAEMKARFVGEAQAAATLEASFAFGALGAVLGLTLGLAGGFARGSARAAWIAAIVGPILGGAAGAGISRALLPIYFRILDPDHGDLILAILIQGGIWPVIGAAGGAAFGIGLGDRGRAVRASLGGLLGALAGVLVYEMVGAVVFPLEGTSSPLSATWGTRLFARLALTTSASAGAAMGTLDPVEGAIASPVSEEHPS